MSSRQLLLTRALFATLGFIIIGVGLDISVKAGLGVSPWTVFHLGITNYIKLTQGQVSQIVGLIIVALSFFLGIKPALGTIMNMLFIGWFYDLSVSLMLIPRAESYAVSGFYVAISLLMVGFGGAMYMSAGLGAGPRDSLMLALTRRSKMPVSTIKTAMDVTVLVLGYFMGGPVGIGTVIYSIGLGPIIQMSFSFFRKLSLRSPCARTIVKIPSTI
ncbi:MAG: membrane protein [bacterium]|nr:membrane protein [bacterium]